MNVHVLEQLALPEEGVAQHSRIRWNLQAERELCLLGESKRASQHAGAQPSPYRGRGLDRRSRAYPQPPPPLTSTPLNEQLPRTRSSKLETSGFSIQAGSLEWEVSCTNGKIPTALFTRARGS